MTADSTGFSNTTVRKILIEAGYIKTPLTEKIADLQKNGMSQKEIAKILKISESCVNANSAYTRGTYLSDQKTKNAIRIKICRERKKQ